MGRRKKRAHLYGSVQPKSALIIIAHPSPSLRPVRLRIKCVQGRPYAIPRSAWNHVKKVEFPNYRFTYLVNNGGGRDERKGIFISFLLRKGSFLVRRGIFFLPNNSADPSCFYDPIAKKYLGDRNEKGGEIGKVVAVMAAQKKRKAAQIWPNGSCRKKAQRNTRGTPKK